MTAPTQYQESSVVHTVGVADMWITNSPDDLIITHALGSCLGVTIHDPVANVGGMVHIMLPMSSIDPVKAANNPYMFVDSGVPAFFKASYRAGAKKERLEVRVAGGASTKQNDGEDYFEIGKRNFVALRRLLWRNGVLIKAQDVGGVVSRTMTLDNRTGEVTIRSNGRTAVL